MGYLELSIKELEKKSLELANLIHLDFKPELVIFISKGSYIIGKEVSDYFDVPLVECFAKRDGGKVKEFLSPILSITPRWVKLYLRSKELNSGLHNNKTNRYVNIVNNLEILSESKRILIVDDSVDTGNTANEVYNYVKLNSKSSSEVKFAALNSFDESTELFSVDFKLYTNQMMIGPWSKDSVYYKQFLDLYNEDKEKGVF